MHNLPLNHLHHELDRYKNFELNTINTLMYIALVEKIAQHKDVSSIPVLLAQFKDDPEYYDILERVKSAIESNYSNVYVKVISQHMNILVKNAPEWGCTFLFEIFQTPAYLKEFQNSILNAKPKEILKLLFMMEERLDIYKDFVEEIRVKLNSASQSL